ncbi:MAG: hypothetical protein ACRDRL_17750 [Sciscionella sp.]
MHPINLTEVLTVVWRDARNAGLYGAKYAASVSHTLAGLGVLLDSHPSTENDAAYAARLWSEAPTLGLSLGDRCRLAVTAGLPHAYARTADAAWTRVPEHLGIDVRLIRD